MGIQLNGTLGIRCRGCNRQYDISSDVMEMNSFRGIREKNGYETNHEVAHDFRCDCNRKLEIQLNVWEYPKGKQCGNPVYSLSWGKLINRFRISYNSE